MEIISKLTVQCGKKMGVPSYCPPETQVIVLSLLNSYASSSHSCNTIRMIPRTFPPRRWALKVIRNEFSLLHYFITVHLHFSNELYWLFFYDKFEMS